MKSLGTLDELPRDYVAELSRANLVPLWPSLRKTSQRFQIVLSL